MGRNTLLEGEVALGVVKEGSKVTRPTLTRVFETPGNNAGACELRAS